MKLIRGEKLWGIVGAAGLLSVGAACGDSSGAGGTGGAGGDPINDKLRSAWNLTLAGDAEVCKQPSADTSLGKVDDHTATYNAKANVQCSTTGNLSYDLDGTASYGKQSLTLAVHGITGDATKTKPVTGSLSFQSEATKQLLSSDKCKFYFEGNKDSEGVEPRAFWLSFTCDDLTDGTDTCSVSQGYAIFVGCTDESK